MPSLPFANLSGQTAVVTGASSGIGRAIALELAEAGANLFIHANSSRAAAEEVAELIRERDRTAEVVLTDLADPAQHPRLLDMTCATSVPDIWINNAGADVLTGEQAEWSFDEKLDLLWKVDLRASLQLSRLIGARMKQRGSGAILNIGWDQADIGMGGDSGEMFSAIKGAIMSFSRSLAKSLAPEVRVNCLAPGWIKTAWGNEASSYWQQRAESECLLARWGVPRDVAHMARYLVSPSADFITGAVIPVNGGFKNSK